MSDVDGDGDLDVLSASGSSGTMKLAWYENRTPTLTVSVSAASISEVGSSLATVDRTFGDDTQPLTVTLSSDDTTGAIVPPSVTILANQTSASFSVSGVDDSQVDGTQTVSILGSAAGYASVADTLDVLDDEVAGFTIVETGGSTTVSETATSDTFTVVLDDEPLSSVVITVTSGDTGEATVDKTSLTFTPANWNTAQTVTVTGVDDSSVDADQTTAITLSIDDANSTTSSIWWLTRRS